MLTTIIALCLICTGFIICVLAIFGIYRFDYVLNRMHVAASCDTLGLLLILLGLIILQGFSFASLKLTIIVIFVWLTCPVNSHLISKLEVLTNKNDIEKIEEIEL